jgi:hypothetical protein
MKKYLFILMFTGICFSEHPDSTLAAIQYNMEYITSAAEKFDIQSQILCAIIFTERTLNYDWKDKALDNILARTGQNSSIGFCQVKLKTAYWIEKVLTDTSNSLYPGTTYRNHLELSTNPASLMAKLQKDSLNILYAAAFIRISCHFWEKSGFPIADQPDIIGTLYSTGLYDRSGCIRKPNENPQANFFGKCVRKNISAFINSNEK